MVGGLGSTRFPSNEFVLLDFYFPGRDGRTAHIKCEVHLVESLDANLLIGVDVQSTEGIVSDPQNGTVTFCNCANIIVDAEVKTRSNLPYKRKVYAKKETRLPPRKITNVQIDQPQHVPKDRDLLFNPRGIVDRKSRKHVVKPTAATLMRGKGGVLAHVLNQSVMHVQVWNASNCVVVIPAHTPMGVISDMEVTGCYLIQSEPALAAVSATSGPSQLVQASSTGEPVTGRPSPEKRYEDGITIYGEDKAQQQLRHAIDKFSNIWKDDGSPANIPEEDWMQIPLIENWEKVYKPAANKVYPLGPKDRKVLDDTFDKLHEQGRMAWSNESTPFGFPCFVIWRNMPDGTRKGRAVVDIWSLNQITVPDSYPMPVQEDILAAIRVSTHISTIDAASFFYQWRVKKEHRHRVAVISHRGQEIFNVAVMGYKNSPAYAQRMIDNLLRPCQSFARAYMDDIVIFSRSIEDHIRHLQAVFQLLRKYHISLKPEKAFIGYPSVQLLGQKVDSFGLTTSEEKLRAITQLEFPKTLRQLETYLGMTGYLRHYIPYYAQLVEPLQARKTLLNRQIKREAAESKSKMQHKREAARTHLTTPSPEELRSFQALQKAFSQPTMLTYFDPTRCLFVDIDASKEYGYGVIVYHLKDKGASTTTASNAVQPILFLSKMLTPAEKNYWPTELEVACLVWTVRKTRHMVEAADHPTVIFTDHISSTNIGKQTTLSSSSTHAVNPATRPCVSVLTAVQP
jgi:hypothetical protein